MTVDTIETAAAKARAALRFRSRWVELVCGCDRPQAGLHVEVFPKCFGTVLRRSTDSHEAATVLVCLVAVPAVLRAYGLSIERAVLGDAAVRHRRP